MIFPLTFPIFYKVMMGRTRFGCAMKCIKYDIHFVILFSNDNVYYRVFLLFLGGSGGNSSIY